MNEDLYGLGGGLGSDEASTSWPLLGVPNQVTQTGLDQLGQEVQQQRIAARPAPPTPQAQPFITWQEYRASNPGVDPAQLYDDYVNRIGPQQLAARGYSPDVIAKGNELFKQQFPRPEAAPKPEQPKEEGVVGNVLSALKQGFGAGTKAEKVTTAATAGDKEALVRLIAEPEPTPSRPLAAFQEQLTKSATTGLWDSAKGIMRAAYEEPQGAVDYMLHGLAASYPMLVTGILGTAAGAPIGGIGGFVTGAAGFAAGAATQEFGDALQSGVREAMAKAGKNLTDPEAVRQFISDQKNYDDIVVPAMKKAGINGLIAGLTAATGGAFGAAAKESMSLAERAAATAGRGVTELTPELKAQAAAAVSPLKRQALLQTLAGVGSQPVGFAAGEYASQVAAGEPANDQAVALQALNGLLMAGAPVGAGALFRRVRGTPEVRPPVEPPKPPEVKPVLPTEELEGRPTPPPPEAAAPVPEVKPAEEVVAATERITPEERQTLYEQMGGLNSEAGVRAALGLGERGDKKVQDAIAAVVAAPDEDKISALVNLVQTAESGKAKYNEELGTRAAALADGFLRSKVNEDALAPYQELIDRDPVEAFNALTAIHVAQDLVKESVREKQAETTPEAAAGAAPNAPEVAAVAPAAEPVTGLKRGRKPSARAAAAAAPTAADIATTEVRGQPRANAPVQQSLGEAIAAATGGGVGAGGLEKPAKGGRRGLKQREPAGVAAAGGEAVNVQPNVPERAAGPTKGTLKKDKAKFIKYLTEELQASPEEAERLSNDKAYVKATLDRISREETKPTAPSKALTRKPTAEEQAQLQKDIEEGTKGEVPPEAKVRSIDEVMKGITTELADLHNAIRSVERDMDQAELQGDQQKYERYARERANLQKEYDAALERGRAQADTADELAKQNFLKAIEIQSSAGNIPKEHIEFYKALANGQTRSALDYIQRKSDNPMYRLLAKFLKQMRVVPEIRFKSHKKDITAGTYRSTTDKIYVDAGYYLQQAHNIDDVMNTFLHEVVHGGTVNALSKAYRIYSMLPQFEQIKNGRVEKLTDEYGEHYAIVGPDGKRVSPKFSREDDAWKWRKESFQEYADQGIEKYMQSAEYKAAVNIFNVFDWLKENHGAFFNKDVHYGAKNPFELVAEVFVDKKLQNFLKTITLPKELTGASKVQMAWQWFIASIRKVLGIQGMGVENALARLVQDVSALMRERPGIDIARRFAPYTPESNVFPATAEETTGHALLTEKYGGGNVQAQERKRETQVEKKLQQVPAGSFTGHDTTTHERTHIAYKRGPDNYDLYEVTDPSTPEGLAGDASTKRVGVSKNEVLSLLQGANSVAVEHAKEFVGGIPEDSATKKVGWENGVQKYQANKLDDGTWRVYRGDDLHDKNKPVQKDRVDSYEQALKLFDGGRLHGTEKLSINKAREVAQRDLTNVEFKKPGWANIDFFDQNNPAKYLGYQIAQALEDKGIKLPDEQRVDYLSIVRNSTAGDLYRKSLEHEYEPLFKTGRKLMKSNGWNSQKLTDLFTALVVAERFPKISRHFTPEAEAAFGAEHRQKLAAANKLLDSLTPEQRKSLQDYAKQWKQVSNNTVDLEVKFGNMEPEVANRIKKAYDFYAPLGEGMPGKGKGATGRSAQGEQIFQKMVKQRMDTIVRGIHNQITSAVADQVSRYVNIVDADGNKLIEVAPITAFRRNLQTGAVEEFLDSKTMSNKSIVFYDQGRPMRIVVNDPRLLKALELYPNRERSTTMQHILSSAAMFNYLYGATKTLLSPVFGTVNWLRDNLTAVAQLDPGITYTNWAKNILSPVIWEAAFREGFANTFPKLLDSQRPAAKLAREAIAAGALVDRKYVVGLDELDHQVGTTLDPSLWMHGKEFVHLEGPLFGFLSGITKTLENQTRMSIYQAGRDSNLSTIRSGVAAKTGTVNFEPKGDFAGIMNPLYVFANARMQGVRTLSQNLGLMPGVQKANRRTQTAAALAVATGAIAGYLLWSNSEKDKDGKKLAGKIPDYKRDSMLIFDPHIPGVPIPQELGFFYEIGNALADYMFGDKHDRGAAATARFVTNAVQNFWPSGSAQYDPIGYNARGSDYILRSLVPTVVMPVYDIATNTNTFGTEIVRNKERLLKQGIPLSEMGQQSGPTWSRQAARGVAATTGVETAPQQWEYVAKQLVSPQINLLKWISGSDPTYQGQRVNPFAARFMPDVSPFANREAYDEAKIDVENAYQKWQRADLADKPAMRQQYDNLIRIRPEMHTIEGKIDKLFQGLKRVPPEQRAERYKQADAKAQELRIRALKRYYEANAE